MYFTLTSTLSSPTTTSLTPLLSSSNPISIFNFPSSASNRRRHGRPHTIRFSIKSSHNSQTPLQLQPISSAAFEKQQENTLSCSENHENSTLRSVAKPIVFTLFCIVVGLFPIFRGFRLPVAIAAAAATQATKTKKMEGKNVVLKQKGHKYSNLTRVLLRTVSELIRSIEKVRSGKGNLELVEAALRKVKSKKKELVKKIMKELYPELRELRRTRPKLIKKAEKIREWVLDAEKEGKLLSRRAGLLNREKAAEQRAKLEKRMVKMEERIPRGEEEYNAVLEKLDEIEYRVSRREHMALSVGVRELAFIERECELLVEKFRRDMRRQGNGSVPSPLTKLSRSDIQKELQSATRQFWKQKVLPSVLEAEDIGYPFHEDSVEFAQRIKHVLKYSRDLQSNLEVGIKKIMKRFGVEKRFVVNTPVDEVVKGFPEVELKRMFGNKEIVVPKAAGLHLFHGWKKWREEAKAELKRNLLENADFGKKYVAEKQERILLDRDRVASKTWYNEERNRWEMDPISVPYAVSRKLVENARIRHDWAVMYLALKGDDKEYFVDIKEFEVLFEDFGGFDGLYLRMLASGTPTSVQLMWIPFTELDFHQQFLLIMRLSLDCLNDLWRSRALSYARRWLLEKIRNTTDDILMMIVVPTVEFIIPFSVRIRLGMAWPEYTDQVVGSSWYLQWRYKTEMSFNSRIKEDSKWFQWFLKFLIRTFIYGYVVTYLFQLVRRKVPRLLGRGPLRRDPSLLKLRRLRTYLKLKTKIMKAKKKGRRDPISAAFDRMKRVKKPPIWLKDFSSIESMREEINEVVAFLQNPGAFQEMGARAPRGVLIVGERGSGKTSLALAIAAEAKVPVVKVTSQQLESGLGVGQGASNVRELFQTARDLAPVIIFVEDFDLFAGVRGNFIHTKQQDHEAFINQLLVELDGFEKQDGVVLMATTRNLKQIDEALRRPGRMDRVFHLQRPTHTEREKILRVAAKRTMDKEVIDFVDWGKVAEKTALLRPMELKCVPVALEGSAFRSKLLDTDELMGYISWFATFRGRIPKWVRKSKFMKLISEMLVNHLGLTLTKEDLQKVVDLMEPYGQISNGIELLTPSDEWTTEMKFPHAVWAAGRGLITLLLPNFDVIDNLWLEPFSWEGIGYMKVTKPKSEGSVSGNVDSRSYLEKKLVFCFGSYVASQLLLPFGEEDFLSSADLRQAQGIATQMVIEYGWGPDDSPTIYHHGNAVKTLSMGNNYEYEIAAKVEKIYDLAYDKAKTMLQNNRRVLERIVEELVETEALSGKHLERILAAHGGIKEKEPFFLSNVHEEPVFSSILENGSVSGAALSSAGN